jgi:hypothetical protein
MPPEDLEAVFKGKPALHRYPGSMAKRTHALCVHIVDEYHGDAEKIWKGVKDPVVLFDRLRALPGYGEEKAKIFLAILGTRQKVAPKGWEACAVQFSDANPHRSPTSTRARTSGARARRKQAQKAQGKSKAEWRGGGYDRVAAGPTAPRRRLPGEERPGSPACLGGHRTRIARRRAAPLGASNRALVGMAVMRYVRGWSRLSTCAEPARS